MINVFNNTFRKPTVYMYIYIYIYIYIIFKTNVSVLFHVINLNKIYYIQIHTYIINPNIYNMKEVHQCLVFEGEVPNFFNFRYCRPY